MTEETFRMREIRKKERAKLRVRRAEILTASSPVLSKHSGNVIAANIRDREFSKIEYDFDDIVDAYANAVANSKSHQEMDDYAQLGLAYARYIKDKTGRSLAIHFCRGLLNEAARRNEHLLSRFQRLRLKWGNPYRRVPQEYIDFPD